jgi:hypothetical protein
MTHQRSSGGASPLPYLQLLEIYKRRQDRVAYERTRTRFNHRFNAYAPDWEAELEQGRALQDYPQVVAQLQATWVAPLDAMVVLETLLFRHHQAELFELPAYRDVLLLYAVARDLLKGDAGGMVDVLLPLSLDNPFEPADAMLMLDGDADAMAARVDLDLSEQPGDSRFDELSPVRAKLQRSC